MDSTRAPHRMPPGAQTLVKYLVSAEFGARRQAADLIMEGHVRVNGMPATSLNHPVRLRDRVDVDGAAVRPRESIKPVYLLLNKPKGYLSTVRDDRGRRTVLDLVPEGRHAPGLVPAGRLDLDSTGLMLLTNDGNLVDMVTHPSYGVEKEYRVVIDRPLSQDRVHAMVNGIDLEDGVAKAKQVRKLSEEAGAYSYAITLVEGKKREIRRMLMEVGRRVLDLERTRLGNITLGQLPPGQVREMTSSELRGLLAVVERPPSGRPPAHRADQDDEVERPRRPRRREDEDRERPQRYQSGPRQREDHGGAHQRPQGRPRAYGDRARERQGEPRSGPREAGRDRPSTPGRPRQAGSPGRPPRDRAPERKEGRTAGSDRRGGDRDRPPSERPPRRPPPRPGGGRPSR